MKKILILFILFSTLSSAQKSIDSLTSGYKNGTLILIGGAKKTDAVMQRFKKEAGGESARIVIIPTAISVNLLNDYFPEVSKELKGEFKKHGLNNVTILNPKDATEANNDQFIESLKTATGIYFTAGGGQVRVVDIFSNTKAHNEMFKLLDRGGVIMGSSSGAMVQSSFLARGDSKPTHLIIGDHQTGLGFIKNAAIDSHVLVRNRHFDMLEVLQTNSSLLGIGIDDKTAAIVKQDTLQVIGNSYVIIYDNSYWSRSRVAKKPTLKDGSLFYFLKDGDKYSLPKRKVIKN